MDDVFVGRDLFCLFRINQRSISVGDAGVAAGYGRRSGNYSTGVSDRLCCEFIAWVECVGLQWHAGEYSGAGLSSVFYAVAAGQFSGDSTG